MIKFEKYLKLVLPPIVPKSITYLRARLKLGAKPAMEYAPQGWLSKNAEITDWNMEQVAAEEAKKWERFKKLVEDRGPLGFSHESTDLSVTRNILYHNIHVSYAYVLSLAAQHKERIKVLDWGGGLGHYYLLGRALLPNIEIEFHCKEVPAMCAHGRKVNPQVYFHDDDECLKDSYDLVLINGSLQYFPNWKEILARLANATSDYLFLTRLPVAEHGRPFVVFQRMHKYNYNTIFLMQIFNEQEVLSQTVESDLKLMREFVVDNVSFVAGAPDQYRHKGWLFKKTRRD